MFHCAKAVLPVCVFVFFLTLSTGLAQSTSNATPIAGESTSAHRAPTGAENGKQFRQMLKKLEANGTPTTLGADLLRNASISGSDQPPIPAITLNGVEDAAQHSIYLLYVSGEKTVLFTVKDGEQLIIYRTDGTGALRKVAKLIQHGRMNTQLAQPIPTEAAQIGFITEKEFWIDRLTAEKPKSRGGR